MKRIVFCFKEDGTVTTNASGFSGGQCTKDTEKILEGLNAKVVQQTFKLEYKVVAETGTRIQQHV